MSRLDNFIDRWYDAAPITTGIMLGFIGFGGFLFVIIMAAWSAVEHKQKDAEWWSKFRVEHNCQVHSVLPWNAGFMDHENSKVAWNCNGEIYLRTPK